MVHIKRQFQIIGATNGSLHFYNLHTSGTAVEYSPFCIIVFIWSFYVPPSEQALSWLNRDTQGTIDLYIGVHWQAEQAECFSNNRTIKTPFTYLPLSAATCFFVNKRRAILAIFKSVKPNTFKRWAQRFSFFVVDDKCIDGVTVLTTVQVLYRQCVPLVLRKQTWKSYNK